MRETKTPTWDETRAALVESIEKWKCKVNLCSIYEVTPSECPLCRVFYKNRCVGCPVSNETGDTYCEGTPYVAYDDFVCEYSDDEIGYFETVKKLAQAEVNFLEMLLEKHDAMHRSKNGSDCLNQ